MGPESTPRLRTALELLLFVMGDCELDATHDRQLFYQQERGAWSEGLAVRLELLGRRHNLVDQAAAVAGAAERAAADQPAAEPATAAHLL